MSAGLSWTVVALILAGVLLVLRRPVGRLLRLALRSCGALALLAALQQLGGLAGVHLGVNLVNALVLALLGVPGFGLLMMLNWALR